MGAYPLLRWSGVFLSAEATLCSNNSPVHCPIICPVHIALTRSKYVARDITSSPGPACGDCEAAKPITVHKPRIVASNAIRLMGQGLRLIDVSPGQLIANIQFHGATIVPTSCRRSFVSAALRPFGIPVSHGLPGPSGRLTGRLEKGQSRS